MTESRLVHRVCAPVLAHWCSDRHLAARGSILHVAVRKAQQEDRCIRDTDSLLLLPPVGQLLILRLGTHLAFLLPPVQGLLHVDGEHAFLRAASHAPTHSQAPQRVAHRRSDASSEVVFEVPVWKADDERPGRDKTPLCSLRSVLSSRVPKDSRAQTLRITVHLSRDKPDAVHPFGVQVHHSVRVY